MRHPAATDRRCPSMTTPASRCRRHTTLPGRPLLSIGSPAATLRIAEPTTVQFSSAIITRTRELAEVIIPVFLRALRGSA